jgi:hypothetical protein
MRLPPALLRIFQRKYILLIIFLPLAIFSVLFSRSLIKNSGDTPEEQGSSIDSPTPPSGITESSEPLRSPQEIELDTLSSEKGSSIEMADVSSSNLDQLRGSDSSSRDALQESSALDSIRSSISPNESLGATSF